MRISELSRLSGLSVHRLRRYDELGLLRAGRSSSEYRDFDDQAVRDAQFIATARELGFSLGQIADVLPRYRARTLTLDEIQSYLESRIGEVDAIIENQNALRLRLTGHVARIERQRQKTQRIQGTVPERQATAGKSGHSPR